MKLIIEHSKTKREINGPFSLCCDKDTLQKLKDIIEAKLSDEDTFNFGWIQFNEKIHDSDSGFITIRKQDQIANTVPVKWNDSNPDIIKVNSYINT